MSSCLLAVNVNFIQSRSEAFQHHRDDKQTRVETSLLEVTRPSGAERAPGGAGGHGLGRPNEVTEDRWNGSVERS